MFLAALNTGLVRLRRALHGCNPGAKTAEIDDWRGLLGGCEVRRIDEGSPPNRRTMGSWTLARRKRGHVNEGSIRANAGVGPLVPGFDAKRSGTDQQDAPG